MNKMSALVFAFALTGTGCINTIQGLAASDGGISADGPTAAELLCAGKSAGDLCRGSTGPCDPAEFCQGTPLACSPDSLASFGTTCVQEGGAGGTCNGADGTCHAPTGEPCDGLTECGNVCTTLATDPNNCGACGNICPSGKCDAGVCSPVTPTGACTGKAANTVCRPATGPCDIAETCDGTHDDCPADQIKGNHVACQIPNDGIGSCNGSDTTCHPVVTGVCSGLAAGTVCRVATGPCDVAETCDGVSVNCPTDQIKVANTACNIPGDGIGSCNGIDTVCHPITPIGVCSGKAAGTVCRAATGPCDVTELCDGVSPNCPTNLILGATVACQVPGDGSGTCDGTTTVCHPLTGVCAGKASTFVCRPSAGSCDVEEKCDGVHPDCPADTFLAVNTTCQVPGDGVGSCDGTTSTCHPVVTGVCSGKSAGTICRAVVGPCDVVEVCDGVSPNCPTDLIAAANIVCQVPGDGVGSCNGVDTTCHPLPGICAGKTSSFVCRPAAGPCDVVETCDGVNPNCPADTFLAVNTTCQVPGDGAGTCNGADSTCHSTVPLQCTADTQCADQFPWTQDFCSGANICTHRALDCGGMKVRLPAGAVQCHFWAGFGLPAGIPAPDLGFFAPTGLLNTGLDAWKFAPTSACSGECYDASGAVIRIDSMIEWNGLNGGFEQNQLLLNLLRATWDGLNVLR